MEKYEPVSVQTFDVGGHKFRIGRFEYYLPPLSLEDAGDFFQMRNAKEDDVVAWMPEHLAASARCTRPWLLRKLTRMPDPSVAVQSLSVTQQAQLFKAWLQTSGVMPGESSRSAS